MKMRCGSPGYVGQTSVAAAEAAANDPQTAAANAADVLVLLLPADMM